MNHKNHSRVFFRWFWVTLIAYIAIGIVAGFLFPKPVDITSLYSFDEETKFNWLLMIGVWISGIIPEAIIYAVYSHLENQEIQIDILDNIYKISNGTNTPKSVDTNRNSYRNTSAANRQATWVCPQCGTTNQPYNERCTNCDNKK